jgi:hypothetical protein
MSEGRYRRFGYLAIAKIFEYHPDTGELYRRLPNGDLKVLKTWREKEGRPTPLWFAGYNVSATYVIWMLQTRSWPKLGHYIDHTDGDGNNNVWTNLRQITPQQSAWKRLAYSWR